ncbi:MAG TPA: hypothetical protein VG755_45235 [Nannocystaceae bacterium]|nr:hypothetical protein [Nannocystaceae bacterium]
MNHVAILAVLLAASCVLDPTKLGEQESEGDGGASLPTTADSGDAAESTSTGGTSAHGIGAPCVHELPAGAIESKIVTFPALDCDGLVCVYADSSVAPADMCMGDLECNAADPSLGRFECALPDAECRLSADYVAARSFCSTFCETSAECEDAEPSACATGFSCVALASIGSAGCRGVCACNDDVDVATSTDVRDDCLAGTAPACIEHPGQGLCP